MAKIAPISDGDEVIYPESVTQAIYDGEGRLDETLIDLKNKTKVASYESAGIVKPDGTSVVVNEDGTMSARNFITMPEFSYDPNTGILSRVGGSGVVFTLKNGILSYEVL